MALKKIATKTPGVRYKLHPSRRHGINYDKYFSIRYRVDGKLKEEGLGWASEGWTEKKAAALLAELKGNHTKGEGPATLGEKRGIKRQEEETAEVVRGAEVEAERLKDATRFDRVFLDYCEAHGGKKSLVDEQGYYRSWIAPYIGEKRLGEILLLDLERIRKKMQAAGRAPRSIQYVKSIVRQVYHFAADRGLYTGEPPTAKFLRNQKVDNKRLRYLEPEEADRLLAEIRKHSEQSYRVALLSLNSGMRFGEIASLRWQHINTDRREILVVDPKNGQSRAVFMTAAVVAMFSQIPKGRQDEIVFPARKGKGEPMTIMDRPSNVFAKAVDTLGLNDGITDRRMKLVFHSLRHSCASWLVNAGVELPIIAKILGHKTLAMTMRYSHVNDQSVKSAMAELDRRQLQDKIVPIRENGRNLA